jgi:erythromycin esterase
MPSNRIYHLYLFIALITLVGSSCRTARSLLAEYYKTPIGKSKIAFINWGKTQQIPLKKTTNGISKKVLQKIAADIGDAKVVMLSEGFHNCEEMLSLHSELIQYLVEEKGYNTILTESGLPESKYINDYIQGKDSIPQMWQKSIGIMYGAWQQGRKNIDWLRQYNQTATQKVTYQGIDIGGFYRDWEFPFEQIFDYLNQVDTTKAQELRKDMAFYFDHMKPYAMYYHMTKLNIKQKNKLASILETLKNTFLAQKDTYIQKSNQKTYQWVNQCVHSMYMAEHYYRNFECMTDSNDIGKCTGLNGRELAMAQNIEWVLTTQPDAKVIVINHVVHTKTSTQFQSELYGHFTPMGQLLKQKLQDDLYIIGMLYGEGTFWNKWHAPSLRFIDTIPPIVSHGIEQVFQAIDTNDYYINLQNAPNNTYPWIHSQTTMRENDYHIQIKPSEWDATFYLQEVRAATLAE